MRNQRVILQDHLDLLEELDSQADLGPPVCRDHQDSRDPQALRATEVRQDLRVALVARVPAEPRGLLDPLDSLVHRVRLE